MTAILIGILGGLLTILTVAFFKQLNKPIIYALLLSGIGFIYVGFTWTDIPALIINAIQAILFLFVAYFGVAKNLFYLAAGYFLHGTWDLVYDLYQTKGLIPPQYDLFCLSIDFTIGGYLLILRYQEIKEVHPISAAEQKILTTII